MTGTARAGSVVPAASPKRRPEPFGSLRADRAGSGELPRGDRCRPGFPLAGLGLSRRRGLNPRPIAYEAIALPLSYSGMLLARLLSMPDRVSSSGVVAGAGEPAAGARLPAVCSRAAGASCAAHRHPLSQAARRWQTFKSACEIAIPAHRGQAHPGRGVGHTETTHPISLRPSALPGSAWPRLTDRKPDLTHALRSRVGWW